MIKRLRHLCRAMRYACQGLVAAYRTELAFRLECWLSVLLIPAAGYWGHSRLETSVLIAVWLLVPMIELINSSIESVVNRIGLAHHPLSGQAKDMAAAAVLLTLLLAIGTWAMLLL